MRFRRVFGLILSPLLLASVASGEVVERILAVVGDRPLMLSEVRLVQQLRGLERAPALAGLTYEKEYASRADAPSFEAAGPEIRRQLADRELDEKIEAWVKELRAGAEIRHNP